MRRAGLLCVTAVLALGQEPGTLAERGYSVIPTPQRVQLAGGEVELDSFWSLDAGNSRAQGIAVRCLVGDFAEFHRVSLKRGTGNRQIRLAIVPGTIVTSLGAETDRQAYRLKIDGSSIEVTGNDGPGLFYGVQTLIQLPKRDGANRLLIPKGVIEDWPDHPLRILHWDAQQHQDRVETLKRYLDWTARFKANMIAFQLEDKFEFPSHPVVGAPGAYTSAQLQELVDYGLERHIQIVPLIQAPAHFSWALKHPEFAELRSDGNNYMANTCDPRAVNFVFSLYDDVIRATKGVDYLFASTDEVYYAGIDPRCGKPYNPENRSLNWVDFVQKARDHLAKRGRTMLIWAEYPLLPEHVKLLPPDIIDGVVGNSEYFEPEKKLGIRQLAYVSMQGVEVHFPDHFSSESGEGIVPGRIEAANQVLSFGEHWRRAGTRKGNQIGVFGAAWDASGLHNETFWLGWSAVAQFGWKRGGAATDRHTADFMKLYYGPLSGGMTEVYRTMQRQARAWERTWDQVPSRARGPSYGNSTGKGIGTQRRDMTLSPPAIPRMPDLQVTPHIGGKYAAFLTEARAQMPENEALKLELYAQFGLADRNRYNLEVFLSIAELVGHHWRLLTEMTGAEQDLVRAYAAAQKSQHRRAVGQLVAAYNRIDRIERQRERTLHELQQVWEKGRYPRGQSVGGRSFVDLNDDTKDY
ncbi:MAG TPA: beta-N-acetylhexosaminidase, partial [Bryobacteraceae bacterium]|nr:beta-N-acetylhexosaminidase [Bryobacteraceae bacterium]